MNHSAKTVVVRFRWERMEIRSKIPKRTTTAKTAVLLLRRSFATLTWIYSSPLRQTSLTFINL